MPQTSREALIATARRSIELGLNAGTVGNFSIRSGNGMLITPTGIAPDLMVPHQIVEMELDGTWNGAWRPSSEWEIHAKIYRSTAALAVIHTHPDHCVALSALQRPIPPFHYMVAGFGGTEIPCARYECFGSSALADSVALALGTIYSGCLMANHGAVTIGPDLATALGRAQKLETLAKQYLLAKLAGEPVLLTPAQMVDVRRQYANYGQQTRRPDITPPP